MERDAVESPVDCVCRDELVQVLSEVKTERDSGLLMYHWS